MTTNWRISAYAVLAMSGLCASALANPIGTTLTLTDNLGNSTSVTSASGVVNFKGVLGNWAINFTTGVAAPPAPGGTLTQPVLYLNSVNIYTGSGAGNVLTITFTEDSLGPLAGSLQNTVSGVQSGTSVFNTSVNGTTVTSQSFGSPLFGGDASAAVQSSSPTTVGIQATLTSTPGVGGFTFYDYLTDPPPVPDGGGTIILFGAALAGVGLLRMRLAA